MIFGIIPILIALHLSSQSVCDCFMNTKKYMDRLPRHSLYRLLHTTRTELIVLLLITDRFLCVNDQGGEVISEKSHAQTAVIERNQYNCRKFVTRSVLWCSYFLAKSNPTPCV